MPTSDAPRAPAVIDRDIPFASARAGQLAHRIEAHLPQPSAVVLTLGLLAVAIALWFLARATRYDVRPVTGTLFVRVDRQTGAMLLCAHPVGTAVADVACAPVSARGDDP